MEKLHAAVARSAFSSQNVQNTPCSDHFLKLGCGKIAHYHSDHVLELGCGKIACRSGAKHICKSKCIRHAMLGPRFEVGMWKYWMLLWRVTVTLELHQIMHLPRKVTLELHQIMHLPRKVTLELHQIYCTCHEE